jgi:hypothetical protein
MTCWTFVGEYEEVGRTGKKKKKKKKEERV